MVAASEANESGKPIAAIKQETSVNQDPAQVKVEVKEEENDEASLPVDSAEVATQNPEQGEAQKKEDIESTEVLVDESKTATTADGKVAVIAEKEIEADAGFVIDTNPDETVTKPSPSTPSRNNTPQTGKNEAVSPSPSKPAPPPVPTPPSTKINKTGQYGLPAGMKIPSSINSSILNGRLLETLKGLPLSLINDALQEYDDAVHVKGGAIRNKVAYLFGVVKRYVTVQERSRKGKDAEILPMGPNLTPSVNIRIQKMIKDGFCSADQVNEKVRSKMRMLSEKDALLAIEELHTVERHSIRNFGSYFMGILNRYMRGEEHQSKLKRKDQRGHENDRRGQDKKHKYDNGQRNQSGNHNRSRNNGMPHHPQLSNDRNSRNQQQPMHSNNRSQFPPFQGQMGAMRSPPPPPPPPPMNSPHVHVQGLPPGGYYAPVQQMSRVPPHQQQMSQMPLHQHQQQMSQIPPHQHQQQISQMPPHQHQQQMSQMPRQQQMSQMMPHQQQMPQMPPQQQMSQVPPHQQHQPPQQPPHQQQMFYQTQSPIVNPNVQSPYSPNVASNVSNLPGGLPPAHAAMHQTQIVQQLSPPQNMLAMNQTQQGSWQPQHQHPHTHQPQQATNPQFPVDILGLADKAASAVQALAHNNAFQNPNHIPPPFQNNNHNMQQSPMPQQVYQSNMMMSPQQNHQYNPNQGQYPNAQVQGVPSPGGGAIFGGGGGNNHHGSPINGGNRNQGNKRRTTARIQELPMNVQLAIRNLQATGQINGQLDDGMLGMVKDLPEALALESLRRFAQMDKSSMRNKTAYLAGVLRRELENIRRR